DLNFAHLLATASAFTQDPYSFSPRSWSADAYGSRSRLRLHCDEPLTISFIHGPDQRVGTLSLDDRDLGEEREKPPPAQLQQSLPDSRTVGQVSSRNDHMVGDFPVHLLKQSDRRGLLSFHAIRIHRVDHINRSRLCYFQKHAQAAIEVGGKLANQGAIFERL